jgi:cytochrome c553
VDKLPSDLKALEPAKLRAVMKSFTIALGTDCAFCHEKDGDKLDFTKGTERTAVAARMWKDWVVGLRTKDGAAVFCDSCHQGKTKFLERGDKAALAAWMKDELVGKLTKADKSAVTCDSCHGKPFEPSFLGGWKTRTE